MHPARSNHEFVKHRVNVALPDVVINTSIEIDTVSCNMYCFTGYIQHKCFETYQETFMLENKFRNGCPCHLYDFHLPF